MKSRTNLILAAIVVMLVAVIFALLHGRNATPVMAAAPAGQTLRIQVQTVPPVAQAVVKPSPVVAPMPAPAPFAASGEVPLTQPPIPTADAAPAIKPGAGQARGYIAVAGDTLSNVAIGLLGSDTKSNRDTVIAANPSLAADPDRVLAGKTYQLASSDPASVAAAPSELQPANVSASLPPAPQVAPAVSDRVLKYTAQPGDSVSVLAAGLLGADSKTNRDAIIGQNKSLQVDPDHIETGKTYKIPAGNGLSAASAPPAANTPAPTTQPDADGVVQIGAGRELRYTARAGDTVSKLAMVLLGSDTQANRDAIVNNNASLKSDPDRVVAGQVYWIPAPVARAE